MGTRSTNVAIDFVDKSLINQETIKLFNQYKMNMSVRELSLKTVYQYEADLNQWFRYIYIYQDNKSILEIDEDDLQEFFYFCKMAGNQSRRNKRRMASISALYKFLRKKKFTAENPMEFIDRPQKDADVYVKTFLTKDQVTLMKHKLKENGNLQLELYANLSLSTMARVNAMVHLRWEQMDANEQTFDDVLEKEGKRVTLYYNDECADLLKRVKEDRQEKGIDDHGWVFYSTRGNINGEALDTNTLNSWAHKVGNLIGVPELHPHDFRHSGSQLMMLEGAPIDLISGLLNHEGLDVTRKFYLRPDKERTKREKDKYSI